MKIRRGFVSNSSSSSFILTFRGDSEEDCFKAMKEHSALFNLRQYDHICNVNDVIGMIKSCIMSPPDIDKIKGDPYCWDENCYMFDLSFIVEKKEEELNEAKKTYEEEKDDKFVAKYYSEVIRDLEKDLEAYKKAKERGHNKAIHIECGDNHGHVSGTNASTAMDYALGDERITKDDLCIIGSKKH